MQHRYTVKVRPMSNAFANLMHFDYVAELEDATEDHEVYTVECNADISRLLDLSTGVIEYDEVT